MDLLLPRPPESAGPFPGLSIVLGLAIVLFIALRSSPRPGSHPPPPGPKGLPWLGCYFQVPGAYRWRWYAKLHAEFGELVSYKLGGQTHVIIGTRELAQEVLGKRGAKYASRTNSLYFEKHIAPSGRHWIFEPSNPYWRLARKLTGPLMASVRAGKTERLQEMEARCTVMSILADKEQNGEGWIDHLARFSSSSIMSATYGHHCSSSVDPAILSIVELNEAVAASANPSSAPINFLPFLDSDLFPDAVKPWKARAAALRHKEDELYFGLMDQMKAGTGDDGDTFWGAMMETALHKDEEKAGEGEGKELNGAFLAGQLVNAAAETTFITLKTFVLAYCLHPAAFLPALAEMDTLVGLRPPTFSDRPALPQLDAILREIYRKYPSLPFGIDHTTTAPDVVTLSSGATYEIPQGALVFGSAWTIEREGLDDPEAFVPQRHFDKEGQLKKFDGTAFGWGRRACPGEPFADRGVWINMALLLWAFTITPFPVAEGGPGPDHPWTGEMISHPFPFRASIVPRSKAHEDAMRDAWEGTEKDLRVLMKG